MYHCSAIIRWLKSAPACWHNLSSARGHCHVPSSASTQSRTSTHHQHFWPHTLRLQKRVDALVQAGLQLPDVGSQGLYGGVHLRLSSSLQVGEALLKHRRLACTEYVDYSADLEERPMQEKCLPSPNTPQAGWANVNEPVVQRNRTCASQ